MSTLNKTVKDAIGELSRERLECLLSTMFEGGIGYWASLSYDEKKYKEAKQDIIDTGLKDQLAWELVLAQMLLNGESLTLTEVENETAHDLNLSAIERSLELWFLNPRYHDGNESWDEVDGEGADIICQFAIFGDIIYG